MTSRSAEQPHVRFASELTVPPADRQKKNHSFYPKVAQEKGHSQRQASFDLFWQWDRLSSVSRTRGMLKHDKPNHLATKAKLEERDPTNFFRLSGEIPQHTRQRKWIFTLSGATRKRSWLALHDVLRPSKTLLQTVPLTLDTLARG